ncbi:hypothetical protein MITS9509_03154 [Synechococcus sp. MIT S9509]|nr:hypothetical protein MITS9504_03060 [Synechococcus sp. MIT S9504]KZR88828.1 hypothetical protein MITS9509_03154 [Synechococcus sp. MIT S9509]
MHLPSKKYGFQRFNIKRNSKHLSVLAQNAWPQEKPIESLTRIQKMYNASSLYETVGKYLISKAMINQGYKEENQCKQARINIYQQPSISMRLNSEPIIVQPGYSYSHQH